jgi:hypothetical protein
MGLPSGESFTLNSPVIQHSREGFFSAWKKVAILYYLRPERGKVTDN